MRANEVAVAAKAFLIGDYPDISVEVFEADSDNPRRRIVFRSAKFAVLYPMQRYHYIIHHIPVEYFKQHLSDTEWKELAPGETEQDLQYPDDELIRNITPDVMRCLQGAAFFQRLDQRMCPDNPTQTAELCQGDFGIARSALMECKFLDNELFDIFHVLMAAGAYCDCEILYNVAPQNRLKSRHWDASSRRHGLDNERQK